MTAAPFAQGPGIVGGDPGELRRAAAQVRPVRAQVGGLATAVAARGRQAADAAGSIEVGAAVSGLASALAKALGDTELALGQLGEVTGVSSDNLGQAGGTP